MRFRTSHRTVVAVVAAVLVAGAGRAGAQTPDPGLGQATLEELMDVQVTSASRKAQRAEDVAAAVFVITRDDIRRSGLTTLPELLRLAPGVQVARVGASTWAISIRGFNDLFANKLLVLVDGRSVYTRVFGGVLWDTQDLMVGDIDRIEVIRGPGGAMWGANAMNGVINVITRSARETQGFAFELAAGTLEQSRLGLRYGGALGAGSYRVFSQWSGYGDTETATGAPAADHWRSALAGGRVDLARGADIFMAQAQYVSGRSRPRFIAHAPELPGGTRTDGLARTQQFSALGRWTRTTAKGASMQVQASHTESDRREIIDWRERTSDVEFQYEFTETARQAIVAGGGLRLIDIATQNSLTLQFSPEHTSIFNGFIHDDLRLTSVLSLVLGAKWEYDAAAGSGLLPSARLLWRVTPAQRVWAAVSRARRTPTIADRSLRVLQPVTVQGMPLLAGFIGNPDYRSETLVEAEAGYRVRFGRANVELALFQGEYDHLPTSEPVGPVFSPEPAPGFVFYAEQLGSLLQARTRGAEVNANWSVTPAWRLNGSYSLLQLTPRVDAASRDLLALRFDGHAPQQQWQLHSVASLGPRVDVDLGLYHSGRLERLAVPAYTRLDSRLEFRLTPAVSLVGIGRNLLDRRHEEFSGGHSVYVSSSIPRTAHVMLRWKF